MTNLNSIRLFINRLTIMLQKPKWLNDAMDAKDFKLEDWTCTGEILIRQRPCDCGKSFTKTYIQRWENKYTKEKRLRTLADLGCPDNCHLASTMS